MTNILEILDRSYSGEKIEDEKKWDMRVWGKATKLSKKYNIKYDTRYAIACDNAMADRCFEAAIALLSDVGVYNIGTKRVIRFEEDELRKGIAQLRDNIILGEGKERFMLSHRNIDSFDKVRVMSGHVPCTEDVAPKLYQAMAEVQSLDMIEGFNFYGKVFGRDMQGIVHETIATKFAVSCIRKAIAQSGRPGLHILFYPISPNPASMIAALDPDNGIRKTDAMEISPLPELKIENNLLAVAAATTEYGAFVNSDDISILHGFGGGPDENPIIGVAQSLQVHMTYHVDYNCFAQGLGMDVTKGNLPENLWCRSMVAVAMARNVKSPCFSYVSSGPEPNNERRWMELAARTLVVVTSGAHINIVRPFRSTRCNLLTPLEIEFCNEIADAIVKNKMAREEANKIVMDGLVPKYKPIYDKPLQEREILFKGNSFEELYDLHTLKPKKEHIDGYQAAKKEMEKMGMKFGW